MNYKLIKIFLDLCKQLNVRPTWERLDDFRKAFTE